MRAAATGAAIAVLAIAAPAPHLGAAPASACTSVSGETVIVDFTHFGRAIERGCAAGHPATALDALQSAGFRSAGTATYGDAFVCRIDGLPAPKTEACANTPPGNASWSFYFAKPSDPAWTYSASGVLSYRPRAGSVMAFAFGNHAKPGVLPSGAVTPRPTTPSTPPPSTPPTTTPRVTAALARPIPASAMTPNTTTTTTTPSTTANTGTTTARPAPSTGPTSSSTTSVPVVDRSGAHIVSRDSSGSPIPVLLTIGIVLLLGAIALLTVRARRGRSA